VSVARARPAALPDASGHFGRFGGRFVPETLMQPLVDLEKAYRAAGAPPRVRPRQRVLLKNKPGPATVPMM
jgi:tryptophan synthase beta chain